MTVFADWDNSGRFDAGAQLPQSGARPRDILSQFLIEAVILSLGGGALGIALGRLTSYLIWYFMKWAIEASLPAIIAAVIVSGSVGIIFGFYPAWKASRLDPIDALRYE